MRSATQHKRACTVSAFVVVVAVMWTATGAVAEGDADLAALSADDLWAQAEQYRSEGDLAQAKRLYTFIADHHADNENRASWALYRLCMLSYNERQIDAALGYIQRVVDQYPDSGICRNGYAASYLTAIHLIFTKDYDAAIQVGEEQLARFGPQMAPLERARVVERLAKSYLATGDYDGALRVLQQNVLSYPGLLRWPEWYQTLFQTHIAHRDYAAALSTARAAYALCDFEEKAIRDAADMVRRGFAVSGEVAKAVQFLQAQEDAQAPNPLRGVPLPQLTDQQREQLRAGAGDDRALRLLVFIYCGDDPATLNEAVDRVATAGADEAAAALLDVARAFKAVDLNLVRANRFLDYARTGEGLNPLAEVEPQ
ncbi:MAG: tetratricopeptide repeat protein [Armatimonadota bacterium]